MSADIHCCPVTGKPVEASVRGRPKVYASEDARALAGFLDAASKLISRVAPDMTPDARRNMRTRLFSLMNQTALRPPPSVYRAAQARSAKPK